VSSPFPDEPLPVEARAAQALRLRRAGVREIAVMRAIERAPRELFAPHRFRDLAGRNMALPIGCGQTMPAPADLGRRLEVLEVLPEHRVLEIGAGSGYGAAVLAQLCREVVSLERCQSLAMEAASRLAGQSVDAARVIFADGLAPPPELGFFQRIIMHVSVEEPPMALLELLAPGGVMVFGRLVPALPGAPRREARLIRLERAATGPTFAEVDRGACRLPAAIPGKARQL
jgi:protein-L-isoaspartate(D-aspartate) O-methyltransferase